MSGLYRCVYRRADGTFYTAAREGDDQNSDIVHVGDYVLVGTDTGFGFEFQPQPGTHPHPDRRWLDIYNPFAPPTVQARRNPGDYQ